MLKSISGRWLVIGLLVLLMLLLLAFRIQRWFWGEKGLFTPGGQGDFVIYLVPTIEVLTGNNPYRMVLDGRLADIPGNSPLFLIAMVPFTLFNLATAKVLWWMVNLVSAIGVVWIIEFYLLPPPVRISRFVFLLILFLASAPTSSAIQIGQTPIVVFFLALLGLIMIPRSPVLSGVLLGLAFSKYSLFFLLIPYLVIDRHFRTLVAAGLTQLAGILIMSWLVSTNPLFLTIDYLSLLGQFASSPTELNLHSRLVEYGVNALIANAISIIGITITVAIIAKYMIKRDMRTTLKDRAILFPLLFIGAIPFVYHRLYDGVVFMLITTSWFFLVKHPASLSPFPKWHWRLAKVSWIAVFVAFLYPRNLLYAVPVFEKAGILFTTVAVLLGWLFLLTLSTLSTNKNYNLPSNNE